MQSKMENELIEIKKSLRVLEATLQTLISIQIPNNQRVDFIKKVNEYLLSTPIEPELSLFVKSETVV